MICLKVVLEKSEMVLSVKNTFDEPVKIEDGFIHTSKKDQNRHGIGLKNVQMVLDKYDGMGMIRYEKGWFYYTAETENVSVSFFCAKNVELCNIIVEFCNAY